MPFVDIADRVRAARIQAGYKRRDDLAADLTLPRFGAKVLGQVERGERPLYEHEAVELGRVLNVEAEWFYGSQPSGALQEILRKLDAIARHLGIDAEEFATAVEAGAGQSGNGTGRQSTRAPSTAGQQTPRSA